MSLVSGPLTPSEIALENEKTKRINKWVLQTHLHKPTSPQSPPTPPITASKSLPHPTRLRPSTMNNIVYRGSVPIVDPRSPGYSNVIYPTTPYPHPTMVPMSAPIQQYNPMSTPYSPNGYPLSSGANQNEYGQQPGSMGMQVNNNTGFRERGSGSRNPSPNGYNGDEGYGQQTNSNFLGPAPGGVQNLYGQSPLMMPQLYGLQPSPIVIMNHPSRSGGRSRSRHHSRSRPRTSSHSRARSRPYSRSRSPEQNYSQPQDRDRGYSNRNDDDEIGIPRDYVPASPGPDRRSRGSRARPGTGGEGASGMDDRPPQHMHNPLGNHPAAEAVAAAAAGYALYHHEQKKHGHGHKHGQHGHSNDHNYGQDLASAFKRLSTGVGGGVGGGGGQGSSSRPTFSRHRSRSIDDRDLQTSRARYGSGGYQNQGRARPGGTGGGETSGGGTSGGTGGGSGMGEHHSLPQIHNPLENHPAAEAAAAAAAGYALYHHEEKKHGHGHKHGQHGHNYGQNLASGFQRLLTGGGGGGGGGGHNSWSRPTFSRHRSRSIDDRDLQTSRARYGSGGYQNQGAGGEGGGYGGGGGYLYQSTPQQLSYQQGGIPQGQGGPNVIHPHPKEATVVPIHDGKGGWMVVPPRGKEVRVVDYGNMHNNTATTQGGIRSRSQPRISGAQPSFFSRIFSGMGRNGRSSGSRVVHPQPANVQYLHVPRHGHGHHSHKHTKKRRDSY